MRLWTRLIGLLLLLIGIAVPLTAQDEPSLPITEDVYYTIRPSDTLDAIGALFDMSPRCIALRNKIERVSELKIGDELLLPVSCPRYAEDPTYLATSPVLIRREVVAVEECAGVRASYSDTITALARVLRVSEEALREANGLAEGEEPTYQQCIVMPGADTTAGAGGGGDGTTAMPAGKFYVVTFGDTLDTIAQAENVSLQTLRIVNSIADNKALLVGTSLFIPADAPAYGEYPAIYNLNSFGGVEGEDYVIQPGDTLDSIAQDKDVSLVSLLAANGIEDNRTIQAGTVITIPTGAPKYGEFPALTSLDTTAGAGGGGDNIYVVQPGDYPTKIAQTLNVDLITFMDVNKIENSYALQPGTVLVIPSDAPPFSDGTTLTIRPAASATPTTSRANAVEATPTPVTTEEAQ